MVKILSLKKSIKGDDNKPKKRITTLLDRIEECDRWGQFDLDTSHLNLLEWPPELLILPGVRNIKANNNKLITIPDISKTFRQLETLNLSRNNIIELNNIKFSNFIVLKTIDISRNNIESLPIEITKLVLLSTLLLQYNKLNNFPNNMNELLNLKYLDVSYNCLEYIGDKLEYIPKLETLNLSNNDNLNISSLSERTRMLYEKRKLLSSKNERRALVNRALGIQKSVLLKEQANIMSHLHKYP